MGRMCRKIQKSPAFLAGDELFYQVFAWFSSAGSHMGQQRNITGRFFLLFFHKKRLPSMHIGGIIAQKLPFVDTGK